MSDQLKKETAIVLWNGVNVTPAKIEKIKASGATVVESSAHPCWYISNIDLELFHKIMSEGTDG